MNSLEPLQRRITRCAIYTRKSTERGLDMPLNSLESQREICQAHIKCQAHRNWVELPYRYDDGGYSGGTLVRPALHRLMADVEAGRIDVVVIYKIDRLTRSLLDFVRLMDVFEKYGASFVSVTQCFDTSDSMGRLILNVLLTFAQFERELMSDRVRDKKAAMRKKGLFAGGLPPFGYLIEPGGRLIVDHERAELVREIFRAYPYSSVREVVTSLRKRGCVTRRWTSKKGREHGGQPITAAIIRQILSNPIYTGHIIHRGEWIEAQVEPIISREDWDRTQEIRLSRRPTRDPDTNFLLGILHDEAGRRMRMTRSAPGHGTKDRYYKARNRSFSALAELKTVFVDADRAEALAKSALTALLMKPAELRTAILSLGLYSDEIGRLLKKGPLAARRISLMDRPQLRSLFVALVPRAQVTRTELTMYISCRELCRLLAWNGVGRFTKSVSPPPREGDCVHTLTAPAYLICGKKTFAVPIQACTSSGEGAKPYLVTLLRQAADLREYVWANRTRSISELAKEKGIGPSHFARLLRVNYLAPDIQAAIIDGTEPPGLTQYAILKGAMPLDWEQQRQLLGFR